MKVVRTLYQMVFLGFVLRTASAQNNTTSTYFKKKRFIRSDPRLEKQFKTLQQESNSWPLAENITDRLLKDICDQILVNITEFPTTPDHIAYVPPQAGEARIQRVLRQATVIFRSGAEHIILLCCKYKLTEFYLARASRTDSSVFRLEKDEDNDCFYFDGVHEIEKRYPD